MKLSDVSKSMVRLPNGRGVSWTPITRDGKRSGVTRAVRRTVETSRRHMGESVPAGPRDAKAKAEYLDRVKRVKQQRAAYRSLGGTPQGSQADAIAADARRSRYRASNQQRKTNARVRHARRAERGRVKQLEFEYRKVVPSSRQRWQVPVYATGAVGAGAYADALSKAVSDADKATVAGGAGALLASEAAMTGGGFAAKKTLARRRMNARKDPAYDKVYRREWGKFRTEQGFHSMRDKSLSGLKRTAIKRKYPKTLKDWRFERALAYKNTPAVAVPAVAGVTAVGALAARKRAQRKQVSKAIRVRDGRLMPVNYDDGSYPYLNMSIAEVPPGVGFRQNPISPLQMLSASNMIADGYRKIRSVNPLRRVGRTRDGVYQVAMGSQMIYRPVGLR